MHYVYSTGTCSAYYCLYENNPNRNVAVIKKKVLIHGGHGVASNQVVGKNIFTPRGVVTQVSDDDMEFLLQNKTFQRHVEAGFICYDKKEISPEKKAANMSKGDKSAPLTPESFIEGDNSTKEAKIYKKPGAPEL